MNEYSVRLHALSWTLVDRVKYLHFGRIDWIRHLTYGTGIEVITSLNVDGKKESTMEAYLNIKHIVLAKDRLSLLVRLLKMPYQTRYRAYSSPYLDKGYRSNDCQDVRYCVVVHIHVILDLWEGRRNTLVD